MIAVIEDRPEVMGAFDINNFVNAIASAGTNVEKILTTKYLTDYEKQAMISQENQDLQDGAQAAREFLKAQQNTLLIIGGIAVAGFIAYKVVKRKKR